MPPVNIDVPCDTCGFGPKGCGKTLRQRLEEVLPRARGDYESELLTELRGVDIPGTLYIGHHPFSPCLLCGESSSTWSDVATCGSCKAKQGETREPLWLRICRWLVS